jgi:hypothetical protein
MILEEEIQRQEEQAMSYKSMGNLLSMNMSTEKQFRAMENYRLSDYHKQLAEWLRELKAYRGILANADRLIESEYGVVIIEGYKDVIDQMNEVYMEVNADESNL